MKTPVDGIPRDIGLVIYGSGKGKVREAYFSILNSEMTTSLRQQI